MTRARRQQRDLREIAQGVAARLNVPSWRVARPADASGARRGSPRSAFTLTDNTEAAAEIATFALRVSGKSRAAMHGSLSRIAMHFALAATVALAAVSAACDQPDARPSETAEAARSLSEAPGSSSQITSSAQAAARFTDLVLLSAPTATNQWALLAALPDGATSLDNPVPILVDGQGFGLDSIGSVYTLAAQPIPVGTRDGAAQFLEPLAPAEASDRTFSGDAGAAATTVTNAWQSDQRFSAPARAINGTPSVMDAAYNAAAAAAAGGTHTYTGGVILTVDPDNPVLQVADAALVQSTDPVRAEDVVYVAIRDSSKNLWNPGALVTLTDVVVTAQNTTVDDAPTTIYVVNAALNGSRVDPVGAIDLQGILQNRLQQTDAELATEADVLSTTGTPQATSATQASGTPQPTSTPRAQSDANHYNGPSFIDDFLIWTWLTRPGYYRGSSVTMINPPASSTRPTGDYYYVPPASTGSSSSSSSSTSSRTGSQSSAVQAARGSVSGQAAGTGGGTAATTKGASDNSAQVGAANSKASSVAGSVSSASAGKGTSSASSGSSGTAAASSGSHASSGGSSSSGSASGSSASRGSSSSGSSSSSGGFSSGSSGKGVSGGSSSSSS